MRKIFDFIFKGFPKKNLIGEMVWVTFSPIDFEFVKVLDEKGELVVVRSGNRSPERILRHMILSGVDDKRSMHVRDWLMWMPQRHYYRDKWIDPNV